MNIVPKVGQHSIRASHIVHHLNYIAELW